MTKLEIRSPTVESHAAPSRLRVLVRGLRKRCPRCGRGRLFSRWYTLHDRCAQCALEYEPADGATWAFMYLSTAFLTGLFIVAMLLTTPTRVWLARSILFPAALVVIVGSLPRRKGLAVAVEYLIEKKIRMQSAPAEDGPLSESECRR